MDSVDIVENQEFSTEGGKSVLAGKCGKTRILEKEEKRGRKVFHTQIVETVESFNTKCKFPVKY